MNLTRFLLPACLSVATLFALSGCAAAYRTPGAESMPVSALAVVEFHDDADVATITQIDGLPRPGRAVDTYELTPGPHDVRVTVRVGLLSLDMKVSFSVAAGKAYRLVVAVADTGEKKATATFSVVDKLTGEQVPRETKMLGMSVPR